jgi:DNA-binding CsgD family transcriptional regulator/PAS domain-containing protein
VPKSAAKIQVTDRSMQLNDPLLHRPLVDLETASSVTAFWSALRAFVQTAFPNHHSATLFLDAKEKVPGALTLHSQPSQRPADWWRARAKLTPTHAYLNDHPGIKLYNLEEMLPPETGRRKRSDFYRHVLRPEGFDKLIGLTTWEKGERKSILVLRRAFTQAAFSRGEMNLLLDLHPIFDRTLRRIEKQEEERVCRSTLQQFINLLPQGVLLVNAKREVVYANPEAFDACAMWNLGPEAAHRMNSRAIFAIPPAFLEAYDTLLTQHYAQALAPSTGLSHLRQSLVHPEQSSLQADLSLVTLDDPLLTRPYLFAQLINRAVLSAPSTSGEQRQLAVLGKLTPREREVALLVRDGLGNEEIATQLHKSVGTIKNQLQSIFAKLGINSRAKLISLLR